MLTMVKETVCMFSSSFILLVKVFEDGVVGRD